MRMRSILVSWTISYLVILLIPILISILIFFQSRHILESEVNRSNMALLNQVEQVIDGQINDVRRIGMQMSIDTKLASFLYNANDRDQKWQLSALDFIRNFGMIRVSNGFIRDFYIYIPHANKGLTSGSVMDAELLYSIYHKDTGLSEQEWRQLLEQPHSGDFLKTKVLENNRQIQESLVFIQSLPALPSQDRIATLFIILDDARIQQSIASVKLENESIVFILNQKNQVLFSTRPDMQPYTLDSTLWQNQSGATTGVWNGEPVTISHTSSDATDWKYITITPTKVYAKKITSIRHITIIGLLFGIGFGGIVVYWFTRRNYRPVRKIMDIVSQRVRESKDYSKNEFNILESVLTKTLEDQHRTESKLKEQESTIRDNQLGRVMKGRTDSGVDFKAQLESHGIHFQTEDFAVLLFNIENYKKQFRADSLEDVEKEYRIVNLIVTNIVGELLNRHHVSYFLEVDGLIACLVNTNEFTDQGMNRLITLVKEGQQFIHSKFHFYFSVGISDIHHVFSEIPLCYQEALKALEYKLIMGISTIIPYDQVKQPKEELYYPLELERQLINFIAYGDYKKSSEVMNEIFMTNFSGGTLSIELAKCLMYELIGTVLKATEVIKLDEGNAKLQRSDLIKRLFQCDSFEEIEYEMRFILELVCQIVVQGKKSQNVELKEQIQSFIHLYYHDVNLGLTRIAEHFVLHPSYVSKFFKEQTGVNVIDYINQYRVGLAKKLLLQENASVQAVSEQIGYLNSNSFIRVFKKYEGITPGQYRQNG